MLTDTLSMDEIENFHITTLEQAISFLQYTKNDDGRYFYDGGHDQLFEANEASVRAEIQVMERFQPKLPDDGDEQETRYHHEIRLVIEAHHLILDDILARPGYVPLAQQPTPQWKIDISSRDITTLPEALNSLELSERQDGTFFYDGDDEEANIIINEEYCRKQLADLESHAPESDFGIDFYTYHNNRQWQQAYRIVIDELAKRSQAV